MRHLPDGDYKWICHAIDHWSKFNFAFPIETKEAESVASVFETYIFPYFGVPKIVKFFQNRQHFEAIREISSEFAVTMLTNYYDKLM